MTVDEQGLIELAAVDQVIEKLKPYQELTIAGVEDKEGLKRVHAARIEVRDVRVNLEKSRKELKASALEFGRRVDAEAKRIRLMLEPIEQHLIDQEEAILSEKKRLYEIEQQKKLAKLNDRLDKLGSIGVMENPITIEAMSDEEFDTFLAGKTEEFEATQARIAAEAEAKRLEEERIAAERAKIEAERAELERLRKEAEQAARAEREAQERRERELRAKLAAEEAERVRAANEAARAEQERIAAERAKIEAEKQAIAEAQRKLEQAEFERQAKIQAEKEAREKLEREQAEAAEQERLHQQRIAEEQARLEAEKPDRQRIIDYCDKIRNVTVPVVTSERLKKHFKVAIDKLCTLLDSLEEAANQ